jgi:hypothetical protein
VMSARSMAFLARLERPLSPAEIPTLDPRMGVALGRLFGLAFLVAGSFFVVASLLAPVSAGGRLAMGAGLLCMTIGGGILYRNHRRATAAL